MDMRKKLIKKLIILLTLMAFLTATVYAQSQKSKPSNQSKVDYIKVKQLAYMDSLRLVEVFKDLHLHPEIGFTETKKAAIIAK